MVHSQGHRSLNRHYASPDRGFLWQTESHVIRHKHNTSRRSTQQQATHVPPPPPSFLHFARSPLRRTKHNRLVLCLALLTARLPTNVRHETCIRYRCTPVIDVLCSFLPVSCPPAWCGALCCGEKEPETYRSLIEHYEEHVITYILSLTISRDCFCQASMRRPVNLGSFITPECWASIHQQQPFFVSNTRYLHHPFHSLIITLTKIKPPLHLIPSTDLFKRSQRAAQRRSSKVSSAALRSVTLPPSSPLHSVATGHLKRTSAHPFNRFPHPPITFLLPLASRLMHFSESLP